MSHDISAASPYRKVSTSTWGDEKIRRLTPILPSGQALFIMLLVGPQTTSMPGVQPVGRMALAEMLGWDLEVFDEAFAEVLREGLAVADWKARLVFVPKAIQHNLPQSPNVVKSWAGTWARVPECDLKAQVWSTLHEALTKLGKSFADAFKTACPLATVESSRKAPAKPSVKVTGIQEQEQEQKQERSGIAVRDYGGGGRF